MILTLALIVRLCFKLGKAEFLLSECALTDDRTKIRTRFESRGITRWGAEIYISGEDFFWFGDNSAKIVRHESRWDQTPEQVVASFKGDTL